MHQSGGLLLAAGLDGGNSLIFARRAKMQIESCRPHQYKKREAIASLFPYKTDIPITNRFAFPF